LAPKNKLLIEVPAEWSGLRLDKALGLHPDIQTRSRAESLIEKGLVTLNGEPLKSSAKLKIGLLLEVQLPEPEPTNLVPLEHPLEVLYEDSDLLVVNKPAGVVVHPSAGHAQDTLVNMLIAHTEDLSMGFHEHRPGIVHRLDRDTSGLLVVAKNDSTQQALSEKFQKRDLHRIYHAVCIGVPPKKSGTLQSFLGRHPSDRKRFASLLNEAKQVIRDPSAAPTSGKWAATHYEVLDSLPSGLSYLKLKLETGRTHQIRVHLSELGCPIVKDDVYGAHRKIKNIQNQHLRDLVSRFPRFALHARELGFQHPRTGEWLAFKVNWPQDLFPLIEKLHFPKWPEILAT
jgi:23S rRNA pseudouridine1911/1915/1917 synthase